MSARAAIGLAALSALAPRAAEACATCACGDPTLTVLGVEKPLDGRLRVSLGARHREERHGDPAHPYVARETRLELGLSYAPVEDLVLSALVPLVRKEALSPGLARDESYGAGDLELRAKLFLWEDQPKLPAQLFGVGAGLDVPLSPLLTRADGAHVPTEAQPSSGALTPVATVFYSAFLRPWSFHASVSGRAPLALQDHFRPGAALWFTGAAQLQPEPWLALRVSADGRVAGAGEEDREPDRLGEGFALFASPELVLSPLTDLIFSASVRIPLVEGELRESPVVALVAIYDL